MNMIELYILDTSDLDYASDQVFSLLSEQRKERIEKLIPVLSKRESCGIELLLSYALRNKYRPPLNISRTEHGKPYIHGCDVHFSLSHTNGICMCAVSHNEIGADAEKMRDVGLNIHKRIASDRDDLPSPIHIWSAKEAFLKLTGDGFRKLGDMQDIYAEDGHISNDYVSAYLYQTEYRDIVLSVCTFEHIGNVKKYEPSVCDILTTLLK